MKPQTVLMVAVCLVICGCVGTYTALVPESSPEAKEQPRVEEPALMPEAVPAAADAIEKPAESAAANSAPRTSPRAETPAAGTAAPASKKSARRETRASGTFPDKQAASDEPREMIALNFDNADIYEVVNALSDFMGVNFIIDQRVKGKVNIHTAGEIDKRRLLPIMETVFEMNNIAMVEYGDFYKIIPIKEAKQQVIDFSIGRELAYVPSYDRQMIQVVPLQYVSAKEIETILKRFLGPGGDVFEYPKGNIVVIVERAASIRKMLRLVREIDIDLFEYNQVRFFKVENANAADVATELEEIFLSIGIEKTPEKGLGLKFIPVERIGGVLAVSSVPGVFDRVANWLEVLDTVDDTAAEQVFIYFVENGKAEEIGDVLNQVYSDAGPQRTTTSRDTQSRTRQDARNRTQQAQSSRTSRTRSSSLGGQEESSLLEGEVSIVVDIPTNSIIVRAIPRDYEIIRQTMAQLDRIPRQVLIEVLIAEVKLDGDTAFGVEWSLYDYDASIGGYKGEDRIGYNKGSLPIVDEDGIPIPLTDIVPQGFSYLFSSERLSVFLQAQASQNKLNILSSPHILAVDNKEARIEVGEEVPIVTSEYVPLDQQDDTSTSRSVEYRSTGVILSVTPRINERGLVAMDVSQEVSAAQPLEAGGIQSPSITNRKAETSLVVQDGQTIIIGGLIREEGSEGSSGIPFLSSIPMIGWVFGSNSTQSTKVELILLLTPHVVTNFEEVDIVTKEIKGKVDNIRRLINKSDDYWDAYKEED